MSNVSLGKLEIQLDNIRKIDLKEGINRGVKLVRAEAQYQCPKRRYGSGGGALKDSIHTEVQEKEDTVTGIVFTNHKYASYVEFGTGPVGQANHEGVSPDIDCAYSQTGWLIPAGAMEPDDAERYGLGVIKRKDGTVIGYATNGQPAQPFMYPALKNNEEAIVKEIKSMLREEIRKAIKK